MAKQYARGKRAWGICGRSGRKMLLKDMVFDGRYPNMRVDPDWYEARHPLETLPMIEDPVALYRPSPEVVDAPSAPVLTLESPGPSQINVTWTPAESGITDIKSYLIFRAVNGGAFQQLAECDLVRDFLGGITGITNATFPRYPERPGDPWATVPPDQPATYIDTSGIEVGSEYCYYVEAVPLGNNQSVAQGPPINSAISCVTVSPPATAYLTSQPYPLVTTEHFAAAAAPLDQPQYQESEDISVSAAITAGTFTTNLITYSNWPPEHIQANQAEITGGTLAVGLLEYTDGLPENVQVNQGAITGGTIGLGLITYDNWPAEHLQVNQAAITGGTLS